MAWSCDNIVLETAIIVDIDIVPKVFYVKKNKYTLENFSFDFVAKFSL